MREELASVPALIPQAAKIIRYNYMSLPELTGSDESKSLIREKLESEIVSNGGQEDTG